MGIILKILQWLWQNVESILAFGAASVTSYLGSTSAITGDQMIAAVLAVLTLIAIGQIRSASAREKITVKIQKLLNRTEYPTVDNIFSNKTDERPLIQGASNELLLLQETGNLITEVAKSEILSFLRGGGKINAVFTSPCESTARLMAVRNANLSFDSLLDRAKLSKANLKHLLAEAGEHAENISIRYIPYPISWTIVVADPNSKISSHCKLIARSAGFKVPYAEKIDISVSKENSPITYAHFASEAKRHFDIAAKLVLLTSPPRSGKTTLLKRLAELLKNNENIYSLISLAQWDNGERIGFEYVSSLSPSPITFAQRNELGKYDLQPKVWAPIIKELRDAAQAGKVIILDEIGPLQLCDESFRQVIMELVDNPSVVMIASIAGPTTGGRNFSADINSILRHPRSSIFHLHKGRNESEIFLSLKNELETAVELITSMPYSMRS